MIRSRAQKLKIDPIVPFPLISVPLLIKNQIYPQTQYLIIIFYIFFVIPDSYNILKLIGICKHITRFGCTVTTLGHEPSRSHYYKRLTHTSTTTPSRTRQLSYLNSYDHHHLPLGPSPF